MKFCISNLAWTKSETKDALILLKKKGIRFLEYSPNLLLNNCNSKKEIKIVKNFWKINNVKLYSMQSILNEINNAYLFGSTSQKKIFYNEIRKKITLAKKLGTKVIVFGSPASRKIFKNKKASLDILAHEMFKKISLLCEKHKIIFCLEANAKIYKTKYLTHTSDAINLVKKINNNYFKINLDLGTIIANKENFNSLIKKNLNLIGHVQISSPHLKNLLKYKTKIKLFIRSLKKLGYKKVVSVEMLKNKNNNLTNVNKILNLLN